MSRKHSFMPTEPRSQRLLCRVCWTRSRRRRDSAKPTTNLTLRRQSVVRGLRRDGCMGALGRTARSLTAKCQTNLVLPVRSAIFPNGETERQRSVAVGKWPCSRLLLMSCPGGAARTIACCGRTESRGLLRCLARAEHRGLLLAGRTKSRGQCVPHLPSFRARTIYVLTVSTVCGRRNERERSAQSV